MTINDDLGKKLNRTIKKSAQQWICFTKRKYDILIKDKLMKYINSRENIVESRCEENKC